LPTNIEFAVSSDTAPRWITGRVPPAAH